MEWALIPLSPDTLSVGNGTDPLRAVLKKQSPAMSGRGLLAGKRVGGEWVV